MAVDGAVVYFPFMFDDPDVAPLEEGFFDGVAVRVAADGAASLVAGEVDFMLGFGLGLWPWSEGADGELFGGWGGSGFSFWSFSFVVGAFWCNCCGLRG